MSNVRIAIPSELPGGLDAAVGQHFGHCDIYTIVHLNDGSIETVETLPNIPHEHGGCMAPVNHLASNGVQVLIAGGMGMRPLQGFHQVGISVFYGASAPSVGAAVNTFATGGLQQFLPQNTCGGGCS